MSYFPDAAAVRTFAVSLTEREALALKMAAEHFDNHMAVLEHNGIPATNPMRVAGPVALSAAEKIHAAYRR